MGGARVDDELADRLKAEINGVAAFDAERIRRGEGAANWRTTMQRGDGARNGTTFFHLFTYGTLRRGGGAAELLEGCDVVGTATVAGTLYDIDGEYPALVLAGTGRVEGEVRRCPAALLPRLDAYERVAEGLFRRVGVRADAWACWAYVAGPTLAGRLLPDRRTERTDW